MELLLSILASLVATILFVAVSPIFSRRARSLFVALCVRLLRVDMEQIFPDKAAAGADIDSELRRAEKIKILTGRGNELQRGVMAQLLGDPTSESLRRIQIILPLADTRPTARNPDWLRVREAELSKFDAAYSGDLLRSQVKATVRYLAKPLSEGRLQLRLYNFPHVGRIIITESVAYINQYAARAHGRDCEIMKFRRGGPIYDLCLRIFSVIWDQASEP